MVAHMSIGVHSPELVRCQGPGPLHLVLCCDNGNGQGWLPPPLADEDREEVQGDTHVPPEEHAAPHFCSRPLDKIQPRGYACCKGR